jgi:outer membrane lipoprotein carrier protein
METQRLRTVVAAAGSAALLLLLGAAAPRAHAASAADWVKKLQSYYDATRDLDADFVQESVQRAYQNKQTLSGRVRIRKPGMMRWDYLKPDPKLFVTNGEFLWVYDPEDKQAMKQNLRGHTLPAAVSFLYGKGNLAAEFNITVVPENQLANIKPDGKTTYPLQPSGGVVLRLVPKQGNARFKELYFVVDASSGAVTQTLMVDPEGGTNHITFRNMKVNTGIPESLFSWKPPAGTSVLAGPGGQ